MVRKAADSLESLVNDFLVTVRAKAMADAREELLGRLGDERGASRSTGAVARQPIRSGVKRDPAVIEKLTEQLRLYIQQNPGQRIELIGKALLASTAELLVPVKRLLEAGAIRTEGTRRATTYFARSRGGAPKKVARRRAKKRRGH